MAIPEAQCLRASGRGSMFTDIRMLAAVTILAFVLLIAVAYHAPNTHCPRLRGNGVYDSAGC